MYAIRSYYGIGLLFAQSVLFWLLGSLPLSGVTPSLTLPIIVFMGVHGEMPADGQDGDVDIVEFGEEAHVSYNFV